MDFCKSKLTTVYRTPSCETGSFQSLFWEYLFYY